MNVEEVFIMKIPKFPDTFSYKLRAIIFFLVTIWIVIVASVMSNFMATDIVRNVMWIVFMGVAVVTLIISIYSAIKAFFNNT